MIFRTIFSILVLFSGAVSANMETTATGINPSPHQDTKQAASASDNNASELPEGVWGKIQRQLEESQYAISHDDKSWGGYSPAQGYKVAFSHQGLSVTQPLNEKELAFGLSLSSWGVVGNQKALKPAEIHTSGQRIEYRRNSITEWYVNRPAGLEQGFTIHHPPQGDGDIELALALTGDLIPQLDAKGQSLSLSHDNRKVLRYSGLKVWDAHGSILPSQMRLNKRDENQTLLIKVSATNAAYPITIDPTIYSEVKILKTNMGSTPNAQFGYAVDIDGDTLVVGADQDTNVGETWCGAVYLFGRNQGGQGNWGIIKKLIASDAREKSRFGLSVSIDSDTLAVGALDTAYLFDRNFGGDENWGEIKKIAGYGSSYVAIQGDTLIIRASEPKTPTSGFGSVFIYDRNHGSQGNWELIKKLSPTTGIGFGSSVALDGDTLIVGSPGDNISGLTAAGSVYVFERNFDPLSPSTLSTDNWGLRKRLVAIDVEDENRFGGSVSIDGDLVVIGAYDDDYPSGYNIGSAYIFARNSGGPDNWGQQKKIIAPDITTDMSFGWATDISGDRVVIGSRYTDLLSVHHSGAAYLFGRDTGGTNNWGEVKRFQATTLAKDDEFGFSAAIDGDTLFVGAYKDDHSGGDDAGSVFLYERNQDGADQWGLVENIIASDSGGADGFGQSVAIDGDTIAAGSSGEILDVGEGAGSVHVFYRHYGGIDNWGEVAKVTALNARPKDYFGSRLSLDGGLLAVSALGRDQGADLDIGAVYLFQRNSGGTNKWGQIEYFEPLDHTGRDSFGRSISLNGDTLAVGAMGRDFIGAEDAGTVYVYQRDHNGLNAWGEVKQLTASDLAAGDKFGESIALDGNFLVVGALSNDNTGGSQAGAAYVFGRDHYGFDYWGEITKLTALDGAEKDYFGSSISIHNDTVVIGARGDDYGASDDAGSAYVFDRNKGGVDNWGQVKKLIASDLAADAEFGNAVSLYNDLIVVGSRADNNSAGTKAGSAYLFQRNEGGVENWGEIARLQASNGTENGDFGRSVATNEEIVAIGAGWSYEASVGHLYLYKAVAPGITVGPTSGLITSESGGQDTFDVVLNTQPTSTVSIDIESSDQLEGIVSPWTMVFNIANWDKSQAVTVTGIDDSVLDGDQAYTVITRAAMSSDVEYDGINPNDVSVINLDDEIPCEGVDLVLLPKDFPSGTHLTCRASSSITFQEGIDINTKAVIELHAPIISIPGLFRIEQGSTLYMGN